MISQIMEPSPIPAGCPCHEVGREEVGAEMMGPGWREQTPHSALKAPRENHPPPLLPRQQVLTKPILT